MKPLNRKGFGGISHYNYGASVPILRTLCVLGSKSEAPSYEPCPHESTAVRVEVGKNHPRPRLEILRDTGLGLPVSRLILSKVEPYVTPCTIP